MKNILLTIEYDGTAFSGWQRQPGRRTVQGELERVLSQLCRQDIRIDGTGRTDAGVHALGQCASFEASVGIPLECLPKAANDLLSESRLVGGDVRILSAEEKEPGFHARHSAVGKTYIYRIFHSESMPVFLRNYRYHVKKTLNVDAMREAAAQFAGKQDFRAFMTDASAFEGSTEKTIYSASVRQENACERQSLRGNRTVCGARERTEAEELVFRVTGSGFLYNMVRIMAGTLIDVGLGRIRPGEIPDIIRSGDRTRAGHTAPPQGLYMARVYFDSEDLLKAADSGGF